ncbi:phenylalanine--tRNA ligase subunit beta [Candidatus Finniella inopinata]|uniref:Phenylalanine--tRNA ligase beta subunit n=1 Tax=Candidatus Finniella inopinata TaxID=1696036 RepID=A0A4Q7DHJ4_9PROT|nr:phenylalanine--tRNA ligase subunit beta [Candidatus Finniella inopinata]RZI46401.1 phenylalanine--tRNA ligase subunit beta [Candidatus Finniella inopinata]
MKFTLSWLSDHLETSASMLEITNALVDLGLEVEGIENPSEKLAGFVVATVETADRHPDADRLSLCQVNDGQGELIQVVCGAKNVRAGMKVAFARVGTVIPATGQALKAGVIRGVESQGMLCSAEELLLAEESNGILDLQTDLPPGSSLAAALGLDDVVIEVSVTPNRADCFSVRGIARDLAAADLGVLKPLKKFSFASSKDCPIKVTLTDPACTYFNGCLIEGVTNGPSPDWLQKRLISVGQKPISALVDITNYLCFDLGQPLHAFDADKISSVLYVQPAKEGETLAALNDQTYTLTTGMTTVRDDRGILALAGVMGGESSACTSTTTRVFLEAAHFDALRIAQTGQALNLHTDARARFERGVDPEQIIRSLNAATHMILDICGGEASQPLKVGCPPENVHTTILTQKKLTSLTGDPHLTMNQAGKSLERLGLTIQSETLDTLTINTPSWRHDLQIEVDLIEEVLRLNGYQNISVTSLPIRPPCERIKPVDKVRQAFCQQGLDEILSWSFTDQTTSNFFGEGVELSAPLNQDMAVLRPSLLTGLLKAICYNQAKSQHNSTFFEIAHQFQKQNDRVHEENVAAGVRVQSTGDRHWLTPPRLVDIFDVKGDVHAVLDALGIQGYQVDASGPDYYHPGRKGTFKQGAKILAYFGEVHPTILKAFDLQGPVMGFEIFLDRLPALTARPPKPLTLSPYQAVTRDFAFVVPQSLSSDALIKTIQKADKTLIQGIQLFDLYQGDKVEAGKKSLGVEVKLQSLERTLTEEDLIAFTQNVTQLVEKHCGGVLRMAAC